MAFLTFKNIGISGIAAVVPRNIIKNTDLTRIVTEQEVENSIKTTGIAERRFADKHICSSDLCYEAAVNLLDHMNIDRNSIDMLIFVSQTPDYRQPTTATILQHRLELPKSVGAFDMNLACSGYIYGLSTSFSYASQNGVNKVLLLVGETLSKIISLKDRATSLLFGDGGSATLIEKGEDFGESYFSLNSDGAGDWVLKIPAGGYRNPSSEESLKEKKYEDGSIRTEEQLFMDGVEVFNFTMREIPKDIRKLLKYANHNFNEIDYIIFHQANKFITDFFAKKLKYPIERVPYSIQKFGNTSAVSIPLTIVSELQNEFTNNRKKLILSGFGGGLSWGSVLLELSDCYISDMLEI